MLKNENIRFDNTYANLPEHFYQRVQPTPVIQPKLLCWNNSIAQLLSLANMPENERTEYFSGNQILSGSEPLAQVYAGHQFGHFVPRLGDGRAILLGEVVNSHGQRLDIQLKGAGRTEFSRGGDGRAALGPVLREYLLSEAFASLGIPTTRSLAVIISGESVLRETPLPGAILTRVAASHIRIGTFEYFAARNDLDAIKTLADYVINRHYPQLSDESEPYLNLFENIIAAQARLIAQWMSVGFIHGVMNTDNMTVSGETIDFGPCAFLDSYDVNKVFSSIDRHGRYAYGNQPMIAQWNLAQLGNALLPLIAENEKTAIEKAEAILSQFTDFYNTEWSTLFSKKLGFGRSESEDVHLIQRFLNLLQKHHADFTISFRSLAGSTDVVKEKSIFQTLCNSDSEFKIWMLDWQTRLKREGCAHGDLIKKLLTNNPAIIPRNHLVEKALRNAVEDGDLTFFNRMLTALANLYDENELTHDFARAPLPGEEVKSTFCGT